MGVLSFFNQIKGKLINTIVLKHNHIRYGDNLVINGPIRVQGNGRKLTIGDNVKINSGWRFNPTGGNERTGFAIFDGEINIGDNVGISNGNFISKANITIEDNVTIGAGCNFLDSNFHSVSYENRVKLKDNEVVSSPILIKEGAFIGAYCIILKGVTIGKKSVIAAGSVVCNDIPDNQIWGGNPAHFIKNL